MKRLVILWIVLLIQIVPAVGMAGKINLIAVNYAPLSYQRTGKIVGVAAETVQEIRKLTKDEYPMVLLPWQRAYAQSQKEKAQAIFPIVRIPEREKMYKWVGPIFSEGDYFFKHKDNPLTITTLEDARAVDRIGVRKDTYPHIMLSSKGFTNLDIGPSYAASYKKLALRRVDLVLLGENTFRHMVSGQGVDPSLFVRTDYLIKTSSAWIGFTPDTPDSVIVRWQKALDALKESGVHDKIMQKNFGE